MNAHSAGRAHARNGQRIKRLTKVGPQAPNTPVDRPTEQAVRPASFGTPSTAYRSIDVVFMMTLGRVVLARGQRRGSGVRAPWRRTVCDLGILLIGRVPLVVFGGGCQRGCC
jgi:hypothetical protein